VAPGDLALTRTHDGYTISRNSLDRDGTTQWWHLIAVVSTFDDAVHFSRALADRDGVWVWVQKSAGEYEPLSDQDVIPVVGESSAVPHR
jgi:hypothetical protein